MSPTYNPACLAAFFLAAVYRVDVYRSESGGVVCVTVGNGVTQVLFLDLLLRTSCSVLAVLLSRLFQVNFDCI